METAAKNFSSVGQLHEAKEPMGELIAEANEQLDELRAKAGGNAEIKVLRRFAECH